LQASGVLLLWQWSKGAQAPAAAFQPQLPCIPQLRLQLCASVLLEHACGRWLPPPLLFVVLQCEVHQPVSIGAIFPNTALV